MHLFLSNNKDSSVINLSVMSGLQWTYCGSYRAQLIEGHVNYVRINLFSLSIRMLLCNQSVLLH